MRYLVVRTENLTKFFGHHRGIEDLTMEVEPGEVYGFLGPEHAGKTTAIRLLMDWIRPSSGQALLFGMEVRRQKHLIYRRVGCLPAQLSFSRTTTIEKLIDRIVRQSGHQTLPRAYELAERFGLTLNRPTLWLTPAEKQCLGLVQAFMHQPDLVMLDEPMRNLDAARQDEVFRLISETRADGRSVFFASKVLYEMERACDRVAVMNAGRLIAVERGLQLRSRALRKVEMRFSGPIPTEVFRKLPNLESIYLEDNKLRCLLHGDPDTFLKLASQYHVMDIISQQPSLEEVYKSYYGASIAG